MAYEFPADPVEDQIEEVAGVNYIYYAASGWNIYTERYGIVSKAYQYVATENQVVFSGSDKDGDTLAYSVGYLDVYVNGLKLLPEEFTATDGVLVSITAGVALNADVEFVADGTFTIADHYNKTETYTKSEIDALLALKVDI